MNIYEKQYFLNYPADGGEPYFIVDGKETTKSSVLETLTNEGHSENFSEFLIETGYAWAAIRDYVRLYMKIRKRIGKADKNNPYFNKPNQSPLAIGDNEMTRYWEKIECLYENGLTWENAREEVAKCRYEEIMREKGRSIDERPCDLSGWGSLDYLNVSEELYQQILRTGTDDKFPHTREQTIGVIKMLVSFGYSPVIAQLFTAEGSATALFSRGNLIYASIKEALRNKTSTVWHGLDEPFSAPYIILPDGTRGSYFEFLCALMDDGDSIKSAMRTAESLRPEMFE